MPPLSAEIRIRLLSLLDREPGINVHVFVGEYNKFRNFFTDSSLSRDCEPRVFNIKGPENDRSSIDRRGPLPIRQSSDKCEKQSLSRCQFCGECHYHRVCPSQRRRSLNCYEKDQKSFSPISPSSLCSLPRYGKNLEAPS
ncbi:hypothetical protein ACTXT7_011977 [Hymenolepis weldensis]